MTARKSLTPGKEHTQYLEEQEEKCLEKYALKSKIRRDKLGNLFRKYNTAQLEYRTEYHRDRDRIIWSKTFKRLQHKTQVFPHYVEDHYRRRLTHSLEVAQIATTIARALKVNETATEAIALGHDLGHTPFGHAGEKALNSLLNKKAKPYISDSDVPICGFDHCVHGIEVITKIEQDYLKEKSHPGLNLSFDVRDGILKHMHDKSSAIDKPLSSIEKVTQIKDYKIYENNKGTIEAQCVYFADKVAYLLSDIEDGIRCRIFKCEELRETDFFKKIWSKYNDTRKVDEKLKLKDVNDFLLFRRKALTVLILDCIRNAKKKLKGIDSVDKVLSCDNRMVFVSDEIENKWNSFYKKWMVKNLFIEENVETCAFKASKIVKDLFTAYEDNIKLINSNYYKNNENAYKDVVNCNEALKLIVIRNYIAGMTDPYAIDQHARLFMSSERVRF